MKVRFLFIFFFTARVSLIIGQIPVGTWRDHLSWNTAEAVAVAGKKVFCSNGVGICIYDMTSHNLTKLTKINGLNDAGVTAMHYAAGMDVVMVGYANGNLDIIAGNNIYNIPDIKRKDIYTQKRINHIFVWGKYAYLSCSFGIVVVDIQLRQIYDDYIIGDNGNPVEVFSMTEYNDYFYAVTGQGLKKADSQSGFLKDFYYWEKVDGAQEGTWIQIVSANNNLYVCDKDNHIFVFDGIRWESLNLPHAVDKVQRLTISENNLLVSTSNGIFIYSTATNQLKNSIQSYNDLSVVAFDATSDNDGAFWIADNRQGLVQWKSAGDISFYLPNGPTSNHAASLRFKADRLLVVGGGMNENGQPLNRPGEIHTFYANEWKSITPQGIYDFTDVDVFENQPAKYFVTSWGGGLYVFDNGVLKTHYSESNSTLVPDYSGNILCGGLLIDTDHKLWVSNDKKVSLLNTNDQWKTLSWQSTSNMGRLTGDNYGQIWTTLGDNGLLVFSKTVSEQGQNGAYHSFYPYDGSSPIRKSNRIANTPDGVIWVATARGPLYYKDPSVILEDKGTEGIHPTRTGTDEPNRLYYVLGSENVLSVAIDGAYRKWFGTETGGVFLFDEDNKSELRHFTVDNSPLFSNKVHDISINERTGEVYFATEYGIVAYRSDAVSSGIDFGNVYAFPNPVRPEYQGEITITGLIKDADVKITDIAGNLVYQTRTLGGQAVWNGRNQQGRRVATGVYLVFCTNDDGSKKNVTKIMFIR